MELQSSCRNDKMCSKFFTCRKISYYGFDFFELMYEAIYKEEISKRLQLNLKLKIRWKKLNPTCIYFVETQEKHFLR